MGRSNTIGELAAALAKAQGQMENAKKGTANTFFRSKYADLAAVWDACRGPLSENGLAVVQNVEMKNENHIAVETILMHSSGEWQSSELVVPVMPMVVEKGQPAQITPQGIGSATSYARRYALAATVGLAQADDDGNSASGKREERSEPARMDEGLHANHRAAIESSDTLESLKKAYHDAIAAAGDDQEAQRGFIALTNDMKKKIGGSK